MFPKRPLRTLSAGVVTVVAALGAGLVVAPSAQAAEIGTISINPKTGTDDSGIDFSTSGACPDTASNVIVSVKGSGFPAEGQNVVGNAPIETFNTTADGGMNIPLTSTMRDYANIAGFSTLQGKYDFTVTCRTAFNGTSLGDFTGAIWFTSNTAYQANDPAVKVDTTTALAVSPSGSTDQGDAVTLTATVSPAGATGTVQFRDGATALGSPVAVTSGTAALTTSNLTVGSHSLTAEFTPSGSGYNASASAAVTHQVKAVAAKPTTTALVVSPADTAAQYTPVSLTATVTPAGANGSVKFTDTVGGTTTTLGTVKVTDGQAALTTSALAPGDHSFTASFVPGDGTYAASDSGNIPFKVGAFAGVSTSQDITTTVEAGALVISVQDPHVVLPSPQLEANGEMLTTAGAINPVTLTDTRAGNPGWTVSGQVTDFSDGATHAINGQNLGWTPKVLDNVSAQQVNAGAKVGPAAALAPGDTGTAGLKSSRTLAGGTGLGTAHLGADLSLTVPTSTVAGTYTATLTLTAI
ncbi:Ig-like domain repeat protein [Streptomyces sp. NPDC058001]|uniref:Ig-like domain repeat protein n=1 Tax=Streptomyces sp. NPDC058001 TaxID=3346300 RepID=UPI0036EAB642